MMLTHMIVGLTILCTVAVHAQHNAKQTGFRSSSQYDDGLFSPVEDLAALSGTHFTTLKHPLFPNHGVRIKKSNFCDGTVDAYTGWIDVEARHLFFYFFESRRDPDKDDVVLWTNGGPGSSSTMGLFMELGPCNIVSRNETKFNPYSWNEVSNIFFIDQPVGVGYSYADFGEHVYNSIDGGKDVAAFTAIFFEHFSKFKGRGYHLAGESYGGRYIPVYATAIHEQNAKLIEAGLTPIHLKSVMIGNGCTDQVNMMQSYYNMQCENKSQPPVSSISDCVHLKLIRNRCEKRLPEVCYDTTDAIDCMSTFLYCWEAMVEPYTNAGYNMYDITLKCRDNDPTLVSCYPLKDEISIYLNDPRIRKEIGTDIWEGNFSSSSPDVNENFHLGLDWQFPTHYYLAALLERGVNVLIYVGANDFVCNWVGNEKMTLSLEWTQQAEFQAQPLSDWIVDGQAAGVTRSVGPLTFATIYGAGHLVPFDQPVASLELVKRWLAGTEL